MAYDCFLSYASQDLTHAESVYARLTAAGFKVWFDKARLQPGYNWHKEIEESCETSRVVLPLLTPRWKQSEWTRYETYGAEAVIPLLVEGRWEDVSTPLTGSACSTPFANSARAGFPKENSEYIASAITRRNTSWDVRRISTRFTKNSSSILRRR
jgi:hypothetical protein